MTLPSDGQFSSDWINIRRDQETGIETVHAHFQGHAYDPHDHDEMLVGVTHQGVQRFSCNRSTHTSTPGRSILIEPGAVHDGFAPEPEGFTYGMLYLPQRWVSAMTDRLGVGDASSLGAAFRNTLTDDVHLRSAIQCAFQAIHQNEGRLARDERLDTLMAVLSKHLRPVQSSDKAEAVPVMERAKEFLHVLMATDVSLDELANYTGIDRFRLTRQFKRTYGQTPHAYLIRLRLRTARALLAAGKPAAEVAAEVGFSDQSHMGVWFRRAYRLTPAAYQRLCTNLTD